MIRIQQKIPFSDYPSLYDIVVPKDNKLRRINELVDFDFILEELQVNYSRDFGRTAIDPIVMFKYLVLKVIYGLSDVDVVEHSRYDMSFKYFLGLHPEDDVINPSSLSKFRKLRLKNMDLMNMLIGKTVGIAIEKGILKSNSIIVDSTHTTSRANSFAPVEILRKSTSALRMSVAGYTEKTLPQEYKLAELPEMLSYSKEMLAFVGEMEGIRELPDVKEKSNYLEEIIADIEDHYFTSEKDRDARVGHKSTEKSFYGYKTHMALTPERLIVGAVVTSGDKGDGPVLPELIDQAENNGMDVRTVIGDTAYSGQNNLEVCAEKNIELVAKLNPVITHGNKEESSIEGFIYNKDADAFQCRAGNLSKKFLYRRKNKNDTYRYRFDGCYKCPIKNSCTKPGAKTKSIHVRIINDIQKKQMEFEKSDRFKSLSKERYKIEAKNSELKNVYNYSRALSYGLQNMEMQGAVTIFVANLSRIIKMS